MGSNIGEKSAAVLYFWGQSNMVSIHTDKNILPNKYKGIFDKIFVWSDDSSSFIKLNTNENYNMYPYIATGNGFACEISAAIDFQESTGRDVYIVKYAKGGTSMAVNTALLDWNVNSPSYDLANLFRSQIKKCHDWLDFNNVVYEKYALIDFQGYSDGIYSIQVANEFGKNRMDFYQMIKPFIGNLSIKQIIIRPHKDISPTHKLIVLQQLTTMANGGVIDGRTLSNVTMVNTDDLTLLNDFAHVDGLAQIEIGKRVAVAL